MEPNIITLPVSPQDIAYGLAIGVAMLVGGLWPFLIIGQINDYENERNKILYGSPDINPEDLYWNKVYEYKNLYDGVDHWRNSGVDLLRNSGVDLYNKGGVDLYQGTDNWKNSGVDLYRNSNVDMYKNSGVNLYRTKDTDLIRDNTTDLTRDSDSFGKAILEGKNFTQEANKHNMWNN